MDTFSSMLKESGASLTSLSGVFEKTVATMNPEEKKELLKQMKTQGLDKKIVEARTELNEKLREFNKATQ